MKTSPIKKEWLLKKNCSLSPKQFGNVMVSLGCLSLLVGLVWAFNGFWFILPFVCLECFGLTLAFLIYSKHATDFERVTLTNNDICLETEIGGMSKHSKIPRNWAVAQFRKVKGKKFVFFKYGNSELMVGQFVSEKRRELFFDEIKGFL